MSKIAAALAMAALISGCTVGRDMVICVNRSVEISDAKQEREAGENDGGGGAQPRVFAKDGDSAKSCAGIQPR